MRAPVRTLCLGALAVAAACAPQPPRMHTRTLPCPAAIAAKEPHDPGVSVTTRCTFYQVHGESAQELRAFMNVSGPSDETGIYDAYTAFALHYGYHDRRSEAQCSMTDPTVELYLVHILPEWAPSTGGGEPGLLERWSHYTTRLSMHEAGHADISVQAANELARAFAALPPSPTCAALRSTAHDVFTNAVTRLKAKHRRYDMRTHHGATQGSVFP